MKQSLHLLKAVLKVVHQITLLGGVCYNWHVETMEITCMRGDLGSLSTTVLFYGTYIAQHETGQVQYHS